MPTRLFSVNIGSGGGGGGTTITARSGAQSITNGSNTVSVVFSSDIGGTSYSIEYSIINTVDADPIMLQGIVTSQLSTGFTVLLNAAADSANYVLTYGAINYV